MASRSRFALLALLVVTAIAFSPLFSAQFTNWDDPHNVIHNPNLNPPSFDGFIRIWTRPYLDLYVPLTYTCWAIVSAISNDPRSFHIINVAIHLATTIAVLALLRALTSNRSWWIAWLAAGVFALHPLQVESVAWISGTKDLLCGLFCAISIFMFLRYRTLHQRRDYRIATAMFIAACLSKPSAVTLPLAALALDAFWLHRSTMQDSVRALWSWFAISAAFACVAMWAQPSTEFTTASIQMRPLIAADAIGFYLLKFLAPLQLGLDYGRHPAFFEALPRWPSVLLLVAIVGGCTAIFLTRRRVPFIAVGTAFGMAMLLPVLGFIPFHFQRYSTVADHYTYTPMIGAAIVLCGIFGMLRERPKLAIPVGVTLLLAYAVLTFRQSKTWHDTQTVFAHALVVNPRSALSHNNLASDALVVGHDALTAEREARAATDLDPSSVPAWTTLGAALVQQHRADEAVAAWGRAVSIGTRESASPATSMAALFAERGDMPRAAQLVESAIAIDPAFAPARMTYGTMLLQVGRPREAAQHLDIAVQLDPGNARSHTYLAMALIDLGRRPEARRQLEIALRIDPTFAPARTTMSDLQSSR